MRSEGKDQHYFRVRVEIAIIALLTLSVFVFSIRYGGHDFVEGQLESLGLSTEIVTVFLILSLTLAVFSFRRWRELKKHIAARIKHEEELQHARAYLESILNNSLDSILTIAMDGTIRYVNPRLEKLTGYSIEQIRGKHFLEFLTSEQKEIALENWSEIILGTEGTYEIEALKADGSVMQCVVSQSLLRGYDEVLIELMDVTERRKAEATIVHQAMHDPLTDLPNRHLLHDRLERSILVAERTGNRPSLLLVDLDRFKEINDTLGHQAGDTILKQLSSRLQSVLRTSDTVARFGGDEFGLLCSVTCSADAVHIARKVTQIIAKPFELNDLNLSVGSSIGIAVFPEHGLDAHSLTRHADVALYRSKDSGDSFVVYAAEDDLHTPQRLAMIAHLRDSVENDGLDVAYQPKISLHNGSVIGLEALARWKHSELGIIPPDEFIIMAERTGLIGNLTDLILRKVLKQMRQWKEEGLAIPVAVNLSARILQDTNFPAQVLELLNSSGIPPAMLEFEITETAIMRDPARALNNLKELDRMGISLSIDDFGTGYSSLVHLRRLPVKTIKIDKSFVLNMSTSEEDASIVRSTIDLAHNLSLNVVAEGVETQENLRKLKQLGCDAVQGFFTGGPQSAELLSKRRAYSVIA